MGESMVDKQLFEAAIRYVLVSRPPGSVLRSLIYVYFNLRRSSVWRSREKPFFCHSWKRNEVYLTLWLSELGAFFFFFFSSVAPNLIINNVMVVPFRLPWIWIRRARVVRWIIHNLCVFCFLPARPSRVGCGFASGGRLPDNRLLNTGFFTQFSISNHPYLIISPSHGFVQGSTWHVSSEIWKELVNRQSSSNTCNHRSGSNHRGYIYIDTYLSLHLSTPKPLYLLCSWILKSNVHNSPIHILHTVSIPLTNLSNLSQSGKMSHGNIIEIVS